MKKRINTKEAADYLGCAATTLKISRSTGTLLGHLAPAYRKIGRTVLYDISALNEWVEQFPPVLNTSMVSQTTGEMSS
jgi:hypothetical protein